MAALIENAFVWDPDGPPNRFDWRMALVTFLMALDDGEELFTDTIEKWQPGYDLQPGERDELRTVELLVRDLCLRYGPSRPKLANLSERNIAEENAAVDRYEHEKARLHGAVLRLVLTNEWQAYFPVEEHGPIQAVREIIIRRCGGRPVSSLNCNTDVLAL